MTLSSGARTASRARLRRQPPQPVPYSPPRTTETIGRVTALAGGNTRLRNRIRRHGEALCTLGGPMLSDAELDTPVPTRLLSNDTVLVDQPMPLRDPVTGLAEVELPGATKQLLTLLPSGTAAGRAAAGDPVDAGRGRGVI